MSAPSKYKKFLVLEDEFNGVSTVPLKWIIPGKGKFQWPNGPNVKALARANATPRKNWSEFGIEKIFHDVETYDEGVQMEEHTLYDSNVESDYTPLMRRAPNSPRPPTANAKDKTKEVESDYVSLTRRSVNPPRLPQAKSKNKMKEKSKFPKVPDSLRQRNNFDNTPTSVRKRYNDEPLGSTTYCSKKARIDSDLPFPSGSNFSNNETSKIFTSPISRPSFNFNLSKSPNYQSQNSRSPYHRSPDHRFNNELITPTAPSHQIVRRTTRTVSNDEIMKKLIELQEMINKRDEMFIKEMQYFRKSLVEVTKRKKRSEAEEGCISLERQLQLPFGNSYSLTCNDSKLLRDSEHREKFIECLKRYAVQIKDPTQRFKKIYNSVFTKTIAAEFNWSGERKMAFKDSETVQTINEYFTSTLDKDHPLDLPSMVKKWLKNKSDLLRRYSSLDIDESKEGEGGEEEEEEENYGYNTVERRKREEEQNKNNTLNRRKREEENNKNNTIESKEGEEQEKEENNPIESKEGEEDEHSNFEDDNITANAGIQKNREKIIPFDKM